MESNHFGDSHFGVDSSEYVLEKVFQKALHDICLWYNIIEDKYFIFFPLFDPLFCPRFSILEHRKKHEDYYIKLIKFLNNSHKKLSSTDCYESFEVTVDNLCFVSCLIIPLSSKFRNADFSSCNVSHSVAMEYFNSIVINVVVVIDKCVIVHRDSERYC